MNNPIEAPWRLRKFLIQIKGLHKDIPHWQVTNILMDANIEADKLAKEGISKEHDLSAIMNRDYEYAAI